MSRKKEKPVAAGSVAKVPVIMQLEALECGAASLAMIMAYYGKWVPLEQVRADCGVSRDGSNAKNVYLAAQSYGFQVDAFRMNPETIREQGRFPCIIHWNFNHFVVLNGFRRGYACINDPARGTVRIDAEEFDKSFTGIVIIPVPGPDFHPEGKQKSMVEFARKRLIGAGAAVAFVMITTIISYMFGIVNPIMSRIFMDRLLSGINIEWLIPFTSILIGLGILQIIVAWVQAVYSLKINGKMSVIGSTAYMWKVLHMPMEFFSQRLAGDIQQRRETNETIAGTLVNTLAPLALNTLMMIFYLVLMLRRSVALTAIGIATIAVNVFMLHIISRKRINITRVMQRDAGKLASTTVSGIEMVETIKASGAERGFFRKWAGYQASVNAQNVKAVRTNALLGTVPMLFSTLAGYAVLILGLWFIMQGELTLGVLQMFQGFLSSFMAPAMAFISTGQMLQEMRTQMERVEDVMEYPEDQNAADPEGTSGMPMEKLHGNVELKNVTFGYSRLAEPLIRDFSMIMKPGSRIAFVGASGSGKSTISKLISGLYNPWEGEVLFDGKPRCNYPRAVMTGSLAVVDQDIMLFDGTVAENIKMWDESIQDFEMILAARDAQIHEDIMQRDGGYDSRITSGGKDLSGGQRQQLEIARVLAQDPSIIILDEATSALDAKTEYEVVRAIKERGITCIVIAHRLSTIRDCDEIIVLDHGRAAERGTHDELMRLGGLYTELVASE